MTMIVNPFRKSSQDKYDGIIHKKNKRNSLRVFTGKTDSDGIVTHGSPTQPLTSPSRMRQRLSSFFRTSSPVVVTLKEISGYNDNHSMDNHKTYSPVMNEPPHLELDLLTSSPTPLLVEDSHSTTSDLSDFMPASPTTATDERMTAAPPSFHKRTLYLAYQVQQILGSTLDEVDEEIDKDWEQSRNKLQQSLASYTTRKVEK
ncbi:MAG: hypothetical protein EXX96DRAFT_574879 [Benjaminiella poitrasii]|nr:MAG: hypothetical protein EXX96DRAFT_574879 [Benjaminiella poitrasii]